MATALFRIIKYGFQSFWRNKWLSSATVAVMLLALLVFIGLILFSVLTNNAIDILKEKIDISVYFKTDAKEDDLLKVKRSVEGLATVKSVEYVSREQALQAFRERHKEDEIISGAINVLENNPLSASLNIKANDPKEYPAIAAYVNNPNFKPYIDQVNFTQNEIVINHLAAIVDTVQKGGIVLAAGLSAIAVLVTLSTIMLTIYSTRDEIGIMRLVGASNKFIRGPYVIQGILYGLIAAALSLAVIAPTLYFANPYILKLMPDMDLQAYFYANIFVLLGYQALFGVALGSISSGIAVARYLKI